MASCALSADARRASPEIVEDISAPSRRGVLALVAGAGITSVVLSPGLALADPARSRWNVLRDRWERASAAAADYHEGPYSREWRRLEYETGEAPELWFEHNAKNGHIARHPVDPKSPSGVFFSPTLDAKHKQIADAWNDWWKRRCEAESQPNHRTIVRHMDALYSSEDKARIELMAFPAPDSSAFVLKVQLALANDDLWDADRATLLADAARLASDG